MICHVCGSKLKVVRTVTIQSGGKTQEAICSGCQGRFVCITLVSHKIEGYGTGAEAVAARLEKENGDNRTGEQV